MAQPLSSPAPFPVIDGIAQVTALSLVLVLLFVGGRVAANLRLHGKIFLDDYAAIAGFGFFMAFTGLCFGIDHYARYVQTNGSWDATAPYFQKAVYAAEVIAPPASLTAKASVLLLYLRIFNPSVPLRRAVAIMVGIVVIVSTPSLPVFSFYCAPNATDTLWDAEIAEHCLKVSPWAAVLQVVDVVINIAILGLPMPSIFGLHLPLKRRLLLAFVLMHGIFGIAASIAGAIYRTDLARSNDATDALWYRSAAFVCFEVELSMTLVSGSFHACWGFVRLAANQRESRKASSSPDYYYPTKERSGDGSDPKTMGGGASSSDTAVSEGSSAAVGRNKMRAGAGYRCSELGPGIRSTTHLHRLSVTDPEAANVLPRTPPALQPGLQAVSPAPSRGGSPLPARTQTQTPDLKSAFAAPTPTAEELAASSMACHTPPCASELEDPHSPPPGPRVVPTGRLMAEIEAAVAAAGKARLVVGTTRPHSGASFVEGVDVQRVPPVPALPTVVLPAGPSGLPVVQPPAVPSKETKAEVYRRSHVAITAGVAEGYREYVVEKVGDEYVVQKASPATAAGPSAHADPARLHVQEMAGRGYSL